MMIRLSVICCFALIAFTACEPQDELDDVVSRSYELQSNCASSIIGETMCSDSYWQAVDQMVSCQCNQIVANAVADGYPIDDPGQAIDDCYNRLFSMEESLCERFSEFIETERTLCEKGYADPASCPDSWTPGSGGGDNGGDEVPDDGGRAGAPGADDAKNGPVKRPGRK